VSVLDAHISFVQSLSKTLQKRKAIQQEFPTYSKDNIYRGMILLKYYFGGKSRLGSIIPNRTTSA
jgi:hypothetical protein